MPAPSSGSGAESGRAKPRGRRTRSWYGRARCLELWSLSWPRWGSTSGSAIPAGRAYHDIAPQGPPASRPLPRRLCPLSPVAPVPDRAPVLRRRVRSLSPRRSSPVANSAALVPPGRSRLCRCACSRSAAAAPPVPGVPAAPPPVTSGTFPRHRDRATADFNPANVGMTQGPGSGASERGGIPGPSPLPAWCRPSFLITLNQG